DLDVRWASRRRGRGRPQRRHHRRGEARRAVSGKRRLPARRGRSLMRHPGGGDVRGKGLFAGRELGRDRATKGAGPAARIKGNGAFGGRSGVIGGRWGGGRSLGSTIVLSPPLVITRPEIDRIVAVLDKAIEEMGARLGEA